MFQRKDLPEDKTEWANVFRKVLGSPDPDNGRQLDGMGGNVSSLSKVCIIEPVSDGADINYTFVAVGIRNDEVDFSSNCGNMTSAIGPFAMDSGLIAVEQGQKEATVRIRNTNTGKLIDATFPLDEGGNAASYGDFAIDGVAGTAAKIKLAFQDPAGSKTGKMLPTSAVIDTFDDVPATCIDVGNPCVFVPASVLEVEGDLHPDAIEAHPTLLRRLDSIRRQAGVKMGLANDPTKVPGSIPKIAMVSAPKNADTDLVVRAISVGQPHRAIPITVAMAIAAAARVPGSTVQQACADELVDRDGITIGHPTGRILVTANFDEKTNEVTDASVFRTARLLMKGEVFWR